MKSLKNVVSIFYWCRFPQLSAKRLKNSVILDDILAVKCLQSRRQKCKHNIVRLAVSGGSGSARKSISVLDRLSLLSSFLTSSISSDLFPSSIIVFLLTPSCSFSRLVSSIVASSNSESSYIYRFKLGDIMCCYLFLGRPLCWFSVGFLQRILKS